ncbi:MAG: hypothetical protein E6G04_02175 [Actinobacteria bacterium]|nr:MAG: hypothetical protein E6G04_02175 [Actinomycetota bacterium]
MSMWRKAMIVCATAALAALGAAPANAKATAPASTTEKQVSADATSIAFAVRPSVDEGGAAPLNFYIGYSEANASMPDAEADGQASWYQFGIAETAAFEPPENCTPQKNAQATLDGVTDLQAWATDYIQAEVKTISAGGQPQPPGVPGFRHACTERLPGFAQSRFPSTQTIPVRATDDYLTKPSYANTCRQDPSSPACDAYKQFWPTFSSTLGKVVRDGSFAATATDQPSQVSDGVLMGAGDGTVVSIGLSRSTSVSRVEGSTLTVQATEATVSTIITGVQGLGPAVGVTAQQLQLAKVPEQLGSNLQLGAVSQTHSCDTGAADPTTLIADAGGLMIFGRQANPGPGAGIMIGGACVRARIEANEITIPSFLPGVGLPGVLPSSLLIPGTKGLPCLGCSAPRLGAPQVVSRIVTRTYLRGPIAWRTAPYWGSALGALALFAGLSYRFRRTPLFAPVATATNRFARQFIRG